ncbi:WD40 repeat domain-containing serine/threonine protein kinase [Halomicronema hongdechloris]
MILKVLKSSHNDNPKVLELFQREAEVLSQLHHPGVPRVAADGYFAYWPQGSDQPLHCILMEKIDGPNLKQWMVQQGNHPISETQARYWLTQLTEVLQLIHRHHCFHRDIKPDNIMLRANGQVVLVDFGAARQMTATYMAQLGATGGITTVSSAGYTPPEQEHGQAVPQSDFYALGRTLIYLLTAQSPTDPTIYDSRTNTFHWRQQADQVSPEFADLIDWLTAPRAVDRPQTPEAILARLAELPTSVSQGLVLPTTTLDPPSAVPSTQMQRDPEVQDSSATGAISWRRRWPWVGIGAASLVGLGLILAWGWQRWQPQATTNSPSPATPISEANSGPVELVGRLPGHVSSVNALQLSGDGQTLISAGADGTIRFWDLTRRGEAQRLEGHRSFINTVVFSRDETRLFSGGADGQLYGWDVLAGTVQWHREAHTSPVNTLAISHDGRTLASGSADGEIKLWTVDGQTMIRTIQAHDGPVNTLEFSADGQWLASGGADRLVRLWDLDSGDELHTFRGHTSYVNDLAISPDGQILFSASADRTIRRWQLMDYTELPPLAGHTSFVNALQVSQDGQILYSGGNDRTVGLWDMVTGQLQAKLTGFDRPIRHMVVHPNGQIVTAKSDDDLINIWMPPVGLAP